MNIPRIFGRNLYLNPKVGSRRTTRNLGRFRKKEGEVRSQSDVLEREREREFLLEKNQSQISREGLLFYR